MVGTKNSGNRSGKRITKWEKAHGHEAGTEKSCPETIKLANAWNKARVQKTKTDAAEEHRKLYGPKPITGTERATLSLDVARIATKNVPQRQGTLRLSVCAGNNIWTEVASKRKANADVGGEPEKKSSRHQKAALAKSEKNNKGNPTCRCRQEYHPELFRHANLREKTKRWHSVLWVRQLDERRRRLWLLPAEIGVGRVTTVNDAWPAPCTPTTLTIGCFFLLKLFIIGQITSYVICSATVTTVNDAWPAPCTPTPLTIFFLLLKLFIIGQITS